MWYHQCRWGESFIRLSLDDSFSFWPHALRETLTFYLYPKGNNWEDERLEVVSDGEYLKHGGYRGWTRGPGKDGQDQVLAARTARGRGSQAWCGSCKEVNLSSPRDNSLLRENRADRNPTPVPLPSQGPCSEPPCYSPMLPNCSLLLVYPVNKVQTPSVATRGPGGHGPLSFQGPFPLPIDASGPNRPLTLPTAGPAFWRLRAAQSSLPCCKSQHQGRCLCDATRRKALLPALPPSWSLSQDTGRFCPGSRVRYVCGSLFLHGSDP